MAKQSRGEKHDPERQPNQPERQQNEPEQKQLAEQGGERTRSRRAFRPAVDIYEVEHGLMLLADVPGATPEGMMVTLERRVLSIHAQAAEHAPEGHSLVYQEYKVGDFECQFTLSGEFDADRIEASLTNGVLSLMIPRAPGAQARTIQIKAGS